MESLKKDLDIMFQSEENKLKTSLLESIKIINKNKFRSDLIEKIENKIDWTLILKIFNKQYENLYREINSIESIGLLLNNRNILRKRLLNDFTDHLLIKILKNRIEIDYEKEIKIFLTPFYAMLYIENLKKDSFKKLFAKNKKYLELGLNHSGKQTSEDRLKAYEEIFIRNDEYRKKWEKNNYRSIAFNVGREMLGYTTNKEKETFYKSFLKFKTDNKIDNHIRFEIFLSTYRKLII